MNNLYAICLILFGTYIGATNLQSLVSNGDYHWELAIVLGIAMYGALALIDLAFVGLKHSIVIGRILLVKIKRWLE